MCVAWGQTAAPQAALVHQGPAVVFDVLFRLLRKLYGEAHVTYVRNITDVDDKIINRANKEGRDWREVAQTYITASN